MKSMRWTFVLASLLAAVTVASAKPDHDNRGRGADPQQQQDRGNGNRGQERRRQPQQQAPPQQAPQQRQAPPRQPSQGRWQREQQPAPTPRVEARSYDRSNGRAYRGQYDRQVDRRRTTISQPRYQPQPRYQAQPRYESRSSAPPRTVWSRFRATNWRSQHQTWGQRGGYTGYRMPVNRFNLYFGRRHHYRMSSFTVRVFDDEPAFYARGYWIVLLDPVPEYWDPDWYDVDYVRIVELDDGYYLLNESDPDVLLAVDIRSG